MERGGFTLLEQSKGKDGGGGGLTIIHNLLVFILLSGHWSWPHEKRNCGSET